MYVLDNLHSVDIQPGELGVTVRKGLKWAVRILDEGMDRFQIQVTLEGVAVKGQVLEKDVAQGILGEGEVDDVWVGQFSDIPARLVSLEHEEAARTYGGLLESMRRAYGEDFSLETFVTVFSYVRMS